MDKTRRLSKKINYAVLDSGDHSEDDSDFVNSCPTKKRKGSDGKAKNTKGNKENIGQNSFEKIKSPCRKSPPKRIPLDEKKFQKEIEKALKLSAEVEKDASKMDNNDDKVTTPQLGSKDSSFITNEEPMINTPKKNESIKVECIDEEPIQSTSTGFTGKRQRKKVNFQEEDSDEFSDNDDGSCDPSSESEWSDFHESPKKKNVKKTENPVSKKPKASTAQKSSKKTSPKVTKAPKAAPCKTATVTPKPTVKLTSPNTNLNARPSVSTPGSCRIGMVKKGFKSPLSSSSDRGSQSPVTSGIGLRLGLSRRGSFKSLHPKGAIK